jgi:hypothetical protein
MINTQTNQSTRKIVMTVEDIDSGKNLVNVFDNDEDDDDDDGIMGKEDNVDVNSNKGGRQLVASCLSGRGFWG